MDLLKLLDAVKTTRFQKGDMEAYIKIQLPDGTFGIHDISGASLHALPDGTPFVAFSLGEPKFIAGERKNNDSGNSEVPEGSNSI